MSEKDRDALERWAEGERVGPEAAADEGERRLLEAIAAAEAAVVDTMSAAEAELVLTRIRARVRKEGRARRWSAPLWTLAVAAALTAVVVLVRHDRPPVVPPRPVASTERVVKETLIRTEVDGREVFIHAVAYELEE